VCGSREYPYPHQEWSLVSIAKFLKGKYEAKLEIPGGRGYKPNNHPWGRY